MADDRPIGLFDSGVGGLSVLREIRRLLPAEHMLYYADSAYCPYGPRPAEFIRARGEAIASFLVGQGAKAIVVACNTASAVALRHLRERFAVPIVGMVPAVKPAAAATASGRIGVLATETTLKDDSFADLVRRFAADVRVETVIGKELVPLVEAGEIDSPAARALVRSYVEPLVEGGADVVVLGCTHYPFLSALVAEAAGPGVAIIDPAGPVARQTQRVLAMAGLLREGEDKGDDFFFTSGDAREFARVASRLLGRRVKAETILARGDEEE